MVKLWILPYIGCQIFESSLIGNQHPSHRRGRFMLQFLLLMKLTSRLLHARLEKGLNILPWRSVHPHPVVYNWYNLVHCVLRKL